ncbi:4-galactosyl-N-acetylglucosaminide 3-alpha-L-fucosyltransferase 9-like [Nelusetta ayraudi]|uniref:4-galactosyl-N-acetylglucosaminide 3-alpha-L-fucosyltransferase 9-like n=1 Tax=Nelusetta ayraudi TaxID=303726 RepID=UPI003F71D4F8
MVTSPPSNALRGTMLLVLLAGAFTVMYFKLLLSLPCYPSPPHRVRQSKHSLLRPAEVSEANKPLVLVWFWPDDKQFPLSDCRRLFNIDNCRLTDDRSEYSKARGVVIHHSAISGDLSNIPKTRPRFQRWIWLNMDSPSRTRRVEGLKSLFNLTVTYRKDSDIHVRWKVAVRRATDGPFQFPLKKRTVCWVLDSENLESNGSKSYSFFTELAKHIEVDLLNKSSEELQGDGYFSVIASCKFYLSFENSVHTDYITETFTRPLAAGTVPVVWGPPRRNYEKFAPGTSFIHVKDFPDAAGLPKFLQNLDSDLEAYMKYFEWWKFYTLRRPLTDERYTYARTICQACRYVGLNKNYRVVKDLYKWFLE